MQLHRRGVIRGKRIDLEEETGLPPGSAVAVSLEPVPQSFEQKRQVIDALCGAWSSDQSVEPLFAEIERRRASTKPRDIDFDVAP